MAKRKKHKKRKHEHVSQEQESVSINPLPQENYPDVKEKDDTDLQRSALFSALNIETRKRYGEELFDDDAVDEGENDDDDDDD